MSIMVEVEFGVADGEATAMYKLSTVSILGLGLNSLNPT